MIDTSLLNVHELHAKIDAAFVAGVETALTVTVVSFGFKYGLPVDADMVVDCRFLPNPHWVPELRPHTGLDAEVSRYVLGGPGASDFLDGYARPARSWCTAATCASTSATSRSRSAVRAASTAASPLRRNSGRRLSAAGLANRVAHRDMGRE